MTIPSRDRGAIVLAGGRSSRFGRDKLSATIDGTAMLDRAIRAVRDVASVVVVVLAPDDPRALPDAVIRAHDPDAHEGPLAGLAAGLAACPREVDRAIVVGGDMPSLRPAVLALLLDRPGSRCRSGAARRRRATPALALCRPAGRRRPRRGRLACDRRAAAPCAVFAAGDRRRRPRRVAPTRSRGRDTSRHRRARRPGDTRLGGRERACECPGHTKAPVGGTGAGRAWGGRSGGAEQRRTQPR